MTWKKSGKRNISKTRDESDESEEKRKQGENVKRKRYARENSKYLQEDIGGAREDICDCAAHNHLDR